jgi:Txe/YoeB family toxin of toxin-antitoxin system
VVIWKIKYTARTVSDSLKLKRVGLKEKTQKLLDIIARDPYETPPHFEKLEGFNDVYSRRINIRHRLVYQVIKKEKILKIISLWGHYDDN